MVTFTFLFRRSSPPLTRCRGLLASSIWLLCFSISVRTPLSCSGPIQSRQPPPLPRHMPSRICGYDWHAPLTSSSPPTSTTSPRAPLQLQYVGWFIAMILSFGPEQTLGWYEIKGKCPSLALLSFLSLSFLSFLSFSLAAHPRIPHPFPQNLDLLP